MQLNLPDNASLEDVKGVYYLEVLRIRQAKARAAKQIGINRTTFDRWLKKRGIIRAYVQDGPNVIPAQPSKKSGATRGAPSSAAPSPSGGPSKSFQATLEEARALRAAHERRRASGGTR